MVGKAVIKELRRRYPESNIVAVDYDPGASEVNQLNRIKLMISVAKANLAEKEGQAKQARDAFVEAGRARAVQENVGAFEINLSCGDGCAACGGGCADAEEPAPAAESAANATPRS